jgi:hypothetical protein
MAILYSGFEEAMDQAFKAGKFLSGWKWNNFRKCGVARY